MLNKTVVAALLVGITGFAGQAFAQGEAKETTKIYALEDGSGMVQERIIDSQTIERTIITGPAYHNPIRNTGVSRINGGVGGAIGGYYIVGSSPSENRSLNVSPLADAYQH